MLPPDPVREPPKYIPPVSKPWVSQGSEKEINEMSFTPRRPLLKYNIKVLRESLNRPAKLNDEVSTKHQITIASYEDLNFLTKMIEFEKGVQAAPNFVENTAQTVWRYPKNATTQYESRYLKDTERKEELKKENLASFVQNSLPLFESALQQNLIFDSFINDWQNLGDEMSSIGGPGEVNLKVSFSLCKLFNSYQIMKLLTNLRQLVDL